jgi:cell wall-associated NlpC family hydrolase
MEVAMRTNPANVEATSPHEGARAGRARRLRRWSGGVPAVLVALLQVASAALACPSAPDGPSAARIFSPVVVEPIVRGDPIPTRLLLSAIPSAAVSGGLVTLRASLVTTAGPVTEDNSPAVAWARRQLGKPYRYGTAGPKTFDCSGLTSFCYAKTGIRLNRSSRDQVKNGVPVSKSALLPGDLVFFGRPVHHVGMYIGGGRYIHAPRTGDVVKISQLSWRRDYAGARRPQRRYVRLYRSTNGQATWTYDGVMIWRPRTYVAAKRVKVTTAFRARFFGDVRHGASMSRVMTVTVGGG